MAEVRSCGVFITLGAPIKRFLLMKHPKRWDLPKGHVDPGESDVECALRELEEETGIRPADVDLDTEFRFTLQYTVNKKRYGPEPVDKELVVFHGRLLRDVEIVVTEHQSYEWFPWTPPHAIQEQTIDPLLREFEQYLDDRGG